MRIGIDARMYNEGLGIGRYISKFVEHLERAGGDHTYVIFLTKKNWDSPIPQNDRFVKACMNIHWYSFAEQIFLPFFLLSYHLDLVHFPHINVPIFYPKRFIVTVHDLILIKHPLSATSAASTRHPFMHAIKHRGYKLILWVALHRAAHIITVSESVKKDVLALSGRREHDVSVIYEAAETLMPAHKCTTLGHLSGIKFFFRAGNAYPHKNIDGLLDAFVRAKKVYPDIHLVLCGQEDFFQKRLVERIRHMQLTESITHLGQVSESCLSWLYTHAYAYIFPSFEEGFGLPAVEAFLNNCPVLSSRIPVLEEICGSAALYFDPRDTSDIARVLELIIEHPELRDDLIEKGKIRARDFSWERLAQETVRVYTRYAFHKGSKRL